MVNIYSKKAYKLPTMDIHMNDLKLTDANNLVINILIIFYPRGCDSNKKKKKKKVLDHN